MHHTQNITLSLLAIGLLTSSCSTISSDKKAEARAKDCAELSHGEGINRFVVDWDEGQRSALESEMKEGVALVRYTCEGIKVLEGCSIAGQYGYAATERKSSSQQISDALSASANLSSPMPGAKFSAALDGERAIDLAYVTVGALTTPMRELRREQVQGEHCKSATHFVYRTQQGAFVTAEGKRGQVRAEAELLRYGGAQVDASTKQSMLSSAGDPTRCDAATPDDSNAPNGCNAPVRVSMMPLAGAGEALSGLQQRGSNADTNSCPSGMVFDGELCAPKSQVKHFVCSAADADECAQQCEKGNNLSCGNLANILLWQVVENDGDPEDFQEHEELLPRMEQACEDGSGDACSLVAMINSHEIFNGEPGPRELKEFFVMIDTGCRNASHFSCTLLAAASGAMAPEELAELKQLGIDISSRALLKIMGQGCNAGAARTCAALADVYFDGDGFIEEIELAASANVTRAAELAAKACLGGVADACFWGAAMYATSDAASCQAAIAKAAPADADWSAYESTAKGWPSLGDEELVAEFCELSSAVSDAKQARTLAQKACTLKPQSNDDLSKPACALAKHIK